MSERSVLVTGASTGIGEACALHLASRGWRVFAGVRRVEDGERVRADAPESIEPVLIDVTDATGVEAALAGVGTRTGGRLTAVVNNAGVAVGGPIEYLPLDDWRRQFEVNVIGQVAVTRAALPLIRAAGAEARVVFIGSIGGRLSTPLLGPYDASKFALEAIAESLRHELRPSGIKVVLIEPGGVKTPIWEKGRRSADEIEASLPPEALERYGWAVAAVRKGIDQQERQGVPPSKVAEVVERALTSARPRARYLVGLDALATAVVTRVLPDSARDAVVRVFTRPVGCRLGVARVGTVDALPSGQVASGVSDIFSSSVAPTISLESSSVTLVPLYPGAARVTALRLHSGQREIMQVTPAGLFASAPLAHGWSQVFVDASLHARPEELPALVEQARQGAASGLQVMIFPPGTQSTLTAPTTRSVSIPAGSLRVTPGSSHATSATMRDVQIGGRRMDVEVLAYGMTVEQIAEAITTLSVTSPG